MKLYDKWVAVCSLIALLIIVGGLIVTGASPTLIGKAGGLAGALSLVYIVLRGIYEINEW